jgi:N-carbamoyl-L-amino-acid hydrolase
LALTPEDQRARDLLGQWCAALGLILRVDVWGNQFATLPGRHPELPGILFGSHLDTQPTGGAFDGVLGVLGGLEVLECLLSHPQRPERSLTLVSWTNEEGARFIPAMLASGAFAGVFDTKQVYEAVDSAGVRFDQALEAIGYKGSDTVNTSEFAAYIELHIEQGPILDRAGEIIGVVEGVQGIRWYEVTITGSETHAGPTPMAMRSDPVPMASRLIHHLYEGISDFGEVARLTVGKLQAYPGSRNTVPGKVAFSVDLRHPQVDTLSKMDAWLTLLVEQAGTGTSCELTLEPVWYSPPVHFDASCLRAIQEAVDSRQLPYRKMVSGAGHDAVYVNRVIPTGMIFIPSKDGISHHEAEYSTPEHVLAGTQVLLDTLWALANPNIR